ncbi:MAG: hypothetical protein HYZ89_01805 [Candidatus Omnitrophica bacterium]|nr:hypothetical protein [Candidatus Omnitrophota bacterium]
MPQWFQDHPFVTHSLERTALLGFNQLVLIAEHERSAGETSVTADNRQSSEPASALQKLFLLNLAAWISKPSGLNIAFYAHLVESNDDVSPWHPTTIQVVELHPLREQQDAFLERTDLEKTKAVYDAWRVLPEEGTLSWVSQIILEALRADRAALRFILLWIALESLFGDESAELNYRLALRLAFFNASNRDERQQLFDKAKKSYELRCRIVHGVRINNDGESAFASVLLETEQLVRNSLQKILCEEVVASSFDGKDKRRKYLDQIVLDGGRRSDKLLGR